ncbi:MAG: NAD+ synthase [Bacteroidales bacterium]|nr:NAD+ synthase [Bacteroidales bacterium]
MKIALAQLNFHIGNFSQNTKKIIDYVQKASSEGAELIVFPELAVSGYPPRDFLAFDDFIQKCERSIMEIAEYSYDIAVVVGAPVKNSKPKGKRLSNAAWFLNKGSVQHIIKKTLLPTYDIFDEYRYFEPNQDFYVINYQGQNLAITICEDLWGLGDNPIYAINPMDQLIEHNPDLIINIAASPYDHQQFKTRYNILKTNAQSYNLPVIYVNHIGAQTELIFDGGSCVIDKLGKTIKQLPFFEETLGFFDTETKENPAKVIPFPDKIKSIHQALVLGIQNYFKKLGFKKAILGLSGGIDSAVTLALAVEALGAENVTSLIMPSAFSSDHSVDDAIQMCQIINAEYNIVSIEDIHNAYSDTLKPYFKELPFDIAEENIQARARAVLLMAFSNKFGHILLNTSNKSEAAVGYGTLYGDMCGGLSVIGDLYKTEVYELGRFLNEKQEVIPKNIISKPPSAELRPDQKDSDSLPDYAVLDRILFKYIEQQEDPANIIKEGFDKNLVQKTLRLVNISEHKRYQAPPVLRVSPKAFGMGRRIPIVAKYLQ